MFETLSDKLNGVFRGLGNKGRLTEKDVDAALREIRLALLEADVNFKVAKSFVAGIRERALDDTVLKSLTPGQQVIKIANEELTALLGGGIQELATAAREPSVILMIGLNGSGKTTTSAKLARHLKEIKKTPLLIAADLNRPAAIQQLVTLGDQIDVEVYSENSASNAVAVARKGVRRAFDMDAKWAIVDTAGRFQIDDGLMNELEEIKTVVSPVETLLVVDAMTGQDAVNVATDFDRRIGITGMVLTKLDGDARGGAALSVVSVTGVPIKFLGTGEHIDALEEFYPDRLASRILGMGDMLTLIEKAQANFDENEALNLEKKVRQATFDLEDFLGQLQHLKKMGPMGQIMDMIPGMASVKNRLPTEAIDENQVVKIEAVIQSMTPYERSRPTIIDGSRRRRIARGSGTTAQDVNQLLNQFNQTRKLMQQMATGKGLQDITRMFR